MFRSDDTERLRRQLDRFAIPMFLADFCPDSGQFEMCALNAAHERSSGMAMQDVIRRPISELLPLQEAFEVNARYAKCIHNDGPVRYRQQLHLPSGPMIWDTTLTHVTLPDGRERVVGTALVVQRVQRNDLDTLAFQDVEYFASTSTLSLNQIADVLNAVEEGRLSAAQLAGSAGMLAGLCRSVHETLEELRAIASGRLKDQEQPISLIDLDPETFAPMECEVDSVIGALITIAKGLTANDDRPHSPVSKSFGYQQYRG